MFRWGGRAAEAQGIRKRIVMITICESPARAGHRRLLAGFCRASVGMALFMAGDTGAALGPFADGTAALSRLPNAEPIAIRTLWPLIQAAQGDRRATLEEVRRLGVDAFPVNRGHIAFAQAVLEGRLGRVLPDAPGAPGGASSSQRSRDGSGQRKGETHAGVQEHGHAGRQVQLRAPCGVEFRVATDDQLDHLVAAIQEHAKGSHDYEVSREHLLAELGVSPAAPA